MRTFSQRLNTVSISLAVVLVLGLYGGSVFSANDKEPDFARGAKSWSENCARCHNMRDPKEFRDDLWKPIVTHMRVRAGLTGQDARDILFFIQNSN